MRRRSVLSSFTLWVVLFSAAFALLQVFPNTGIVLMMLGSPLLNQGLVYLAIGAFVADCLFGPLPRVLVVLPLAGIGLFGVWYKTQYDADRAAIAAIERQLQGRNTAVPVPFDPATQSLVSAGGSRYLGLYRVPVVYMPRRLGPQPGGYRSFTLRPRHDCNAFNKTNPGGTDRVTFVERVGFLCVTHGEVAALPGTPVEVRIDSAEEIILDHKVVLSILTLVIDGQPSASVTSGITYGLLPWPFLQFGCFLNDSNARWVCPHSLGREVVILDSVPGADTPTDTEALDMLLKIDRRTPAELAALTAR